MGTSIKPKYVITMNKHNMITTESLIGTYNRKPNLELEVQKYIDSLKIGGVNEHLSKTLGYMPIPNHAALINQQTRTIIQEWNAPAFMAF